MHVLKLKAPSGNVNEIKVEEILEIDGKPYQPSEGMQELRHRIDWLEGRLHQLQEFIFSIYQAVTPADIPGYPPSDG